MAFEGYTSELSLAIIKAICQELYKNNHRLHTLEIGYFKGRTTNLVLENKSIKHIVVDPYATINEKHRNRVEFIKLHSRYIEPRVQSYYNNIDYMFIDGGHEKGDLWNDLELANKLLTENGILIVDDIKFSSDTNGPSYPHLINTIDDYCNTIGSFVKICLVDHKQMILCRPEKFIDYYYFLFFKVPEIIHAYLSYPIAILTFNRDLFEIIIGWEDIPVKYIPYGKDNFYLPLRVDANLLNQENNKLKELLNIQ